MAVSRLETAPDAAPRRDAEAELVEGLKARAGISRVLCFTAETGEKAYFKPPPIGVWRRFRAHMQNPGKREDAAEILVRSCLLHPEAPQFDAWLETHPALIETFGDELALAAGLSKTVEKKVF